MTFPIFTGEMDKISLKTAVNQFSTFLNLESYTSLNQNLPGYAVYTYH